MNQEHAARLRAKADPGQFSDGLPWHTRDGILSAIPRQPSGQSDDDGRDTRFPAGYYRSRRHRTRQPRWGGWILAVAIVLMLVWLAYATHPWTR